MASEGSRSPVSVLKVQRRGLVPRIQWPGSGGGGEKEKEVLVPKIGSKEYESARSRAVDQFFRICSIQHQDLKQSQRACPVKRDGDVLSKRDKDVEENKVADA